MQLKVTFDFHSAEIPISYNHIIQGIIYKALSANPDFASYIHDSGYQAENRGFKLFTFGPLTGSYRVFNKQICFSDHATLEIRSHSSELIQALLLYFTQTEFADFGDKKIAVKSCKLDDKRIYGNEIVINSLSPVVSYITKSDAHTVFFSPEEKEFYKQIVTNAKRKFQAAFNDKECSFQIIPADDNFKKYVTKFKSTYITGYTGKFIIKGTPMLLDLLYNTGLGAKNSQGFGMFEVIEQSGY